MMDESQWIERAQSAEAKLETLKQAYGSAIDRVKEFKKTFGVRERSDGSIDIDFQVFAKRLGTEAALTLRHEIDQRHGISGALGEKPRVKVQAVAQNAAQAAVLKDAMLPFATND